MVNPNTVKAWKIDLKPYKVKVDEDHGEPVMDEYDVKDSLCRLLFHPDLKLTVDQAFEQKDLVDKVRAADEFVIIDFLQFQRVRAAYNVLRSPSMDDLEFLRRLRDAQPVEATVNPGT
jgi:hypothetical protein